MYARTLSVLALGLLIFVAGQRALYAQQQQHYPCQAEFNTLRNELQTKGKALQEASKRKATPKELCARVTSYANAEIKMQNFFEGKSAQCSIPPDASARFKTSQAKTVELRTRICDAAANPGLPPAPPSRPFKISTVPPS